MINQGYQPDKNSCSNEPPKGGSGLGFGKDEPLNKLSLECFQIASANGFHSYTKENEDLVIPRDLMLIVSELSEALEALRESRKANLPKYFELIEAGFPYEGTFKRHVKDSFEDEISDTIIRLLHLCGVMGIDIDTHVRLKMEYNKTREHKHGGKKF